MRLRVATNTMRADALIYCLFEGSRPPAAIEKLYEKRDFSGKEKEQLMVYTASFAKASDGKLAPQPRVMLIGLGKEEKDRAKRNVQLRSVAARIVGALTAHKLKSAVLSPLSKEDLAVLVGGLLIADYRFREYQPEKAKGEARIGWIGIPGLPATVLHKIERMAESVNWTRDLCNHPGNQATPAHLATHLKSLRKLSGVRVTTIDRQRLKKLKMGAILAVAHGSKEPPFLMVGEYRPRRAKNTQPYVLVGKGVTFDTGGINLKSSEALERFPMKYDMSGAAAVFGVLKAAATLRLPYQVVAIAPLVENMVSSQSMRPDDVITTAAGLTVEIANTDAEGRLILADALHFAKRYQPAAIIDLATLTGAAIVALGFDTAAAFSRDSKLPEEFRQLGELIGEYVWPMPLAPRHNEMVKSEIADLSNSVVGRFGGAIEGAMFLSKFVDEKTPWVHLDIAGPADTKKPHSFYREPGATGFGVRLLISWLRQQ